MIQEEKTNIVLIGMPGAGKSTVGVLLAKEQGLGFIDTDIHIQTSEGRSLQNIVDTDGHLELRRVEAAMLMMLSPRGYVIATGGSAPYSDEAMQHLKGIAHVVFLDVDLPTLKARVKNFTTRGLAKRPDQTFEDLFEERHALYETYADLTIDCGSLTQEQICQMILDRCPVMHP